MSSKTTFDLRYLKIFLVGPPGVGKTTTLDRLLKTMVNICSVGDTHRSTLLANCIQVFAFVSSDGANWISSNDLNKESILLFRYLCGCKLEDSITPHAQGVSMEIQPPSILIPIEQVKEKTLPVAELAAQTVSEESNKEGMTCKATVQLNRISEFIGRLQKLIKSSDDPVMLNLLGSTLLSINDIGGQPGFLEMLPALSTGPAMYLVFFDLSKELDKPYKIPFSRDDTIITPYDAVHTVESTISQILSAITSVHCISGEPSPVDTSKSIAFDDKFKTFQEIRPVAALIGTHKDQVEEPVKHNLAIISQKLEKNYK